MLGTTRNIDRQQDYHYIATKIDGKFNQKADFVKSGDTEALLEVIERLKDTDTYITSQTYYDVEHGTRTEDNIAYLKRLTIDLDITLSHFVDHFGDNANLELDNYKKFILMELQKHVFNRSIPNPSSVLDSGVGLHIRYDLDNESDLDLYRGISEYIGNKIDTHLKQLGTALVHVDITKLGANNFFRLEGTTNTKNGNIAKVIYNNGYTFNFNEIIDDYLTDYEAFTRLLEAGNVKQVYNAFNPIWTEESRAKGLCNDLKRVQNNLNRKQQFKGHRYILLSIYAETLSIIDRDTVSLQKKLDSFNQSFVIPLPLMEFRDIYHKTIRNAEPQRHSKNKLIKLFSITWHEQRFMEILVGQAIKQERQSSKRKLAREKAKMKRDEAKHQETLTIIKLQADGFTQRQISEQLGISLGTVNNRLKETKRT